MADVTPGVRLLRVQEVSAQVGLSVSEVYRRVSAGDMPRPIDIGIRPYGTPGRTSRASRWVSTEIDAYIARRIDAARQSQTA